MSEDLNQTAGLKPLEMARIARQKRVDDGTPITRMNPVEKALANPNSKAMAIRAMCYQCVGGERAVDTIRNCSSHACALHPHRPYQVGSTDEDDAEEAVTETVVVDIVNVSALEVAVEQPVAEQPVIEVPVVVENPDAEHFIDPWRLEDTIDLEHEFLEQERLQDAIALEQAYLESEAA
jgi:hypothetical protein